MTELFYLVPVVLASAIILYRYLKEKHEEGKKIPFKDKK